MKRMIALTLCLVMVLGLFTGIVSAADPTIGNPIQEKTQLTDVSQLSTITSDYYHANFQHDGVTYYLRLGAVIMGNVHIDDGGSGSRDLADAASTVYYLAAFYTFDELTEQWIRVSEATAGTLLALFDGTAGNQFSMRVEPTANCEYIPAVNKVTHMGDWVAEYPWLAGSQIIYSDSTGDCLGTYRIIVEGTMKNGTVIRSHVSETTYRNTKTSRTFSNLADANAFLQSHKPAENEIIELCFSTDELTGTLVIPDTISEIYITGGYDNGPNDWSERLTLNGGIESHATNYCIISNIDFVGAGAEKEMNGSVPNYALYGENAQAGNCRFTDYYHALHTDTTSKAPNFGCGNCVFVENHTAVYLNYTNDEGGNLINQNNVYALNDIAIEIVQMSKVGGLSIRSLIVDRNSFELNEVDVSNTSGQFLWMPNNYFFHGKNPPSSDSKHVNDEDATPALEGTITSRGMKLDSTIPYPVAYDRFFNEYRYLKNCTVSNSILEQYPLDNAKGNKNINYLEEEYEASAEYIYTEPEKAPEPAPVMFRMIRSLRSLSVPTMDAQLGITRTEDTVTASAPAVEENYSVKYRIYCGEGWDDATVTCGDEIIDSTFADNCVSFTALDRNVRTKYVIEKKTTQPEAEPDKPNSLLGSLIAGAAGSSASFSDVAPGTWYYGDVAWANAEGLMNGTGFGQFSPDAATSRAMIVTILWRLEGSPMGMEASSFSDVNRNSWYGYAVDWAAAFGIVEGYDGKFAPNDSITREQLAAILYRYAKYKGYDVWSCQTGLTGFGDAAKVSDWAAEPMKWAVGAGLITGSNEQLMPQNSATRAQTAAMLHRFFG